MNGIEMVGHQRLADSEQALKEAKAKHHRLLQSVNDLAERIRQSAVDNNKIALERSQTAVSSAREEYKAAVEAAFAEPVAVKGLFFRIISGPVDPEVVLEPAIQVDDVLQLEPEIYVDNYRLVFEHDGASYFSYPNLLEIEPAPTTE